MGSSTWRRGRIALSALCTLLGLIGCSGPDGGTARDATGTAPPTGTAGAWVTERFDSGVRARTDILWMVDDELGNEQVQARLADAADVFLDVLDASGTDWQVGVIAEDGPGPTGALLATADGTRVLTPGTPSVAARLAELLEPGVDGDPEDQGMLAVLSAIAQATEALEATNRGMFRDGADLDIVVVSDQDDDSRGVVPDDIIRRMARTLDPAQILSFSAIVGPRPDGCIGAGGPAQPAPRYLDIVAAANGRAWSYCASDLDAVVVELAVGMVGAPRRFALAGLPDPDLLDVWVDHGDVRHDGIDVVSLAAGRSVADSCQARGFASCFAYRYDAEANAVTVEGTFVPHREAEIVVRYVPADDSPVVP